MPSHPAVSMAPGYAPPLMDSSGAMFAHPPGHVPQRQMGMQQQPGPYPVASAFPAQGGMVYFLPRQQPGPPPSQPQCAPLPPPVHHGTSASMYEAPVGACPSGPGRPPIIASGLTMSVPISVSSSTSSHTPTGTATPSTSHHKRLASSDPSAGPPASKPKRKKKAKPSKDQPKRFICDFESCGRAFARQFNLQTHAKSHLNIRDYDCAHCDKKFSRRHDRGRHCAAVHPEAANEDLQVNRGTRVEGGEEGEEGEEGSGEEYPDVSGLVLP